MSNEHSEVMRELTRRDDGRGAPRRRVQPLSVSRARRRPSGGLMLMNLDGR